MATNVKKSNKKRAKKVYNTKLPMYVAIGLAALVAIIVGVYFLVDVSTNYVAKVDGHKIKNYEYEFFISEALQEVSEELEATLEFDEDATDTEKNQQILDAWTDEWKQKAQDLALEKAVDYETGYLLAKKAGFKLTKEEKSNIKSNVDYQLNMYYQIYNSYYQMTYEEVKAMLFGTLSVSDYKKIALKESVTEKYRESLKADYTATDEELRAIYDEDPDTYRSVSARVFKLGFGTAPVLEATQPKRADGTVITADLADITDSEKEQLETYEAAVAAYNEKKAAYDAKVEEIKTRANNIAKALNETGKYSETNADGEAIYSDADFVTIIKTESALDASTDEGLKKVSKGSGISVDEVDNFILSYQWDSSRTGIIVVEKPAEEDTEETTDETVEETPAFVDTEGKKPTDITVIETENAIYLVRCEDITDFDNSVESEEGAADSIKDGIRNTLFDERATEELEKIIEDERAAGKTYQASSKKSNRMRDILDKVFG